MNTITKVICFTATTIACLASFTSEAHAKKFVAADSSPSSQLCMAVASNKPINLIKRINDYSMTRKSVSKVVKCNSMPIASFAKVYELDRTGRLLKYENAPSISIKDIAMLDKDNIVIAGSR